MTEGDEGAGQPLAMRVQGEATGYGSVGCWLKAMRGADETGYDWRGVVMRLEGIKKPAFYYASPIRKN